MIVIEIKHLVTDSLGALCEAIVQRQLIRSLFVVIPRTTWNIETEQHLNINKHIRHCTPARSGRNYQHQRQNTLTSNPMSFLASFLPAGVTSARLRVAPVPRCFCVGPMHLSQIWETNSVGANVIYDFTTVTFSVKLGLVREKLTVT